MSDPGDPETTATYDRVAPLFHREYGAMVAEIEQALSAFLSAAPGGPILDAGCGTGRDMAWMEAHGAEVTGVDASSGMLSEARKIVGGPLHRMDMRDLDLPDEAFAGAWCNAALLHVPKSEVPGVLGEFRRVLMPDGVLAFSLQSGAGEGYEENPYDGQGVRYFARYTLTESVVLAERAGFQILHRAESAPGVKQWIHVLAAKRV